MCILYFVLQLKLLAELRLAESMLQEYVPISTMEEVTRQLNQMTVKYRELVDKQLILVMLIAFICLIPFKIMKHN